MTRMQLRMLARICADRWRAACPISGAARMAVSTIEIGAGFARMHRAADAVTREGLIMETLILRTVDGDDTLSIVEHLCADARALLATLAPGRVLRTSWCGSTLEADVSVA